MKRDLELERNAAGWEARRLADRCHFDMSIGREMISIDLLGFIRFWGGSELHFKATSELKAYSNTFRAS